MYKTTIGLEFHIEVLTKSKVFATSSTDFHADVNTNVDPITMAYPGTLPALNKEVIKKAIQACTLFGMDIDSKLRFDRKCYFYTDNPKNYQITQMHFPIGSEGTLEVNGKSFGIERIHIEEDTAKQTYKDGEILINYNRAGNPLIELVTKPDINSADEAYDFVKAMRDSLLYSNISDARMDQGSLRCDVNISISKTETFGTKIEIKNLNSISNVRESIKFEIERQKKLLEDGQVLEEETRRWDESKKETIHMRSKDTSEDYIYLPDANMPPINISDKFIKDAQASMPASHNEIRDQLVSLELSEAQIADIMKTKALTHIVIDLASKTDTKRLVNFLLSDVSGYINTTKVDPSRLNLKSVTDLFKAIDDKTISSKQAKDFVKELFTDKDINKLIKSSGKTQISDESKLKELLLQIKEENKHMLEELTDRPKRVEKHFIGQLMKKTQGQANPQVAMKVLKEVLY